MIINNIAEKISKIKAEIKYYENLNLMEPNRMLTAVITNLKVRKNTLEELV